MESAGFKEWAIVCEALGRGEQCVIVRKGGIAEGRAGFAFREREFFLFPTNFHEQVEKTRLAAAKIPETRAGEITIRFAATIEAAHFLTGWAAVERLAPLHVLRTDTVRERFDADGNAGVHVALVRIFALEPAWSFPDEPAFGGCRSWLKLPAAPAELQLRPVLTDAEFRARTEQFAALLGAAGALAQ